MLDRFDAAPGSLNLHNFKLPGYSPRIASEAARRSIVDALVYGFGVANRHAEVVAHSNITGACSGTSSFSALEVDNGPVRMLPVSLHAHRLDLAMAAMSPGDLYRRPDGPGSGMVFSRCDVGVLFFGICLPTLVR